MGTKSAARKVATVASSGALASQRADAKESKTSASATSTTAVVALVAGQPAPEAQKTVAAYADQLLEAKGAALNECAAVLERLITEKPEALVPVIDRLAIAIGRKTRRAVSLAAEALPAVARVAPARVAKNLELLRKVYDEATPAGKDGLVRTFAALCNASVAYQKRLEPVLTHALGEADGKSLLRWSQTVLPALKGEPHARARAVVVARLGTLPRPHAAKLADYLGVKLRVVR